MMHTLRTIAEALAFIAGLAGLLIFVTAVYLVIHVV
jgi:hypothetical protein